ncbi:ABC transporter permease subunit [Leucobacter sp. CSA1]|uniref:ABC transporter permease subunit n=1 Tax=Leucobacter chromiisoli TaxID=2796471 RepID=A0A934UT91_9MICO|nr:ABC transporter permease subunit [Leucobacter chromiisoli]MBK0418129.1 ABC transporter permease subunit [Leucobacter chromiisoli]
MSRTLTVPVHVRARGKAPRGPRRTRRGLVIASFLGPALVVLGALVVYPIVYTVVRSLFDRGGQQFVGWQNYVTMFTNDTTFTAIRNNLMWVLVAPAACTILGLIFAVLLEKLGWKTAFKLIVFMPMAISMLAAGVIFRGLFQENPQLGAVNAAIVGVNSVFSDQASYPGAKPRDGFGVVADQGVIASEGEVAPGSVQDFPLTGVRQSNVPEEARDAQAVSSVSGTEISGTVFLDVIRGGGGVDGEIEAGKKGLPGIRVDAVAADGSIRGFATTGAGGEYTIEGLDAGETYRVALPAANFDAGAQGVSWLSSAFINAVIILAYIWIWAGFAMVMIASGLSAMDRSLQDAARTDGANEWQVFTKITAPLLAPVLVVVFITLLINVLKIFDLVYVIPPGASKPAANVIAVEMWTVSFGGGNDHGLGSALAILLLILVLPSMVINVRRFREERGR